MSTNRRPRPKSPRPSEEETGPESPAPATRGKGKGKGKDGAGSDIAAAGKARLPVPDDEIEWEEDYDGSGMNGDGESSVEEFPISWKELPLAVRKSAEAFFQRTAGFTCVRLERGSQIAYIVEIGDDLARELECPPCSLTLAPTGMLIEVARAVHPTDLPPQVQTTMARHYNGVAFEGGEEVTMHFYELAYTVAGETRVVQVDSSGVILSDEAV
jgi:hypothetical protein